MFKYRQKHAFPASEKWRIKAKNKDQKKVENDLNTNVPKLWAYLERKYLNTFKGMSKCFFTSGVNVRTKCVKMNQFIMLTKKRINLLYKITCQWLWNLRLLSTKLMQKPWLVNFYQLILVTFEWTTKGQTSKNRYGRELLMSKNTFSSCAKKR